MIVEKSLPEYVMVFEKCRTGYCAYVPDLPGCTAAGLTMAQTQKLMREALVLHLKGMRGDRRRIPRPTSLAELRRKGLIERYWTASCRIFVRNCIGSLAVNSSASVRIIPPELCTPSNSVPAGWGATPFGTPENSALKQ
jgi:predicted RNase H-like HicB family nuclease